tara:strand:+ start:1573 stop:1989 length:417 start_codon:yes stop_codon:yes gene_type:complete
MNIPLKLIEVLDITLAGFLKRNEPFLISIFHRKEEILQVINKNMLVKFNTDQSELGIVLVICFDKKNDSETLYHFENSHFKFESKKTDNTDKGLIEYFLPLPNQSEKAAKKICNLLEKAFQIKSNKYLSFEFYEIEIT